MIVSVIAVIISGLSLYESHQNRKLTEATARAVLTITSLRVLKPWAGDGDLELEMTLSNLGRSVASGAVAMLDHPALFFKPSGSLGYDTVVTFATIPSADRKLKLGDFGPGQSRVFRFKLRFPSSLQGRLLASDPPPQLQELDISGHVAYDDPSLVRRREYWSFSTTAAGDSVIEAGEMQFGDISMIP